LADSNSPGALGSAERRGVKLYHRTLKFFNIQWKFHQNTGFILFILNRSLFKVKCSNSLIEALLATGIQRYGEAEYRSWCVPVELKLKQRKLHK
jgi:hypothetical protein